MQRRQPVSGHPHTYAAVQVDGRWKADVDVNASSGLDHNPQASPTAGAADGDARRPDLAGPGAPVRRGCRRGVPILGVHRWTRWRRRSTRASSSRPGARAGRSSASASPTRASDRPSFTIALPPPNITGALHLGHACGFSIQDTLSRHHRMRGFEVEWCPGTDHAAIATQNVIERQLAAEGTTKEEIGREMFQARVDAWYEEYGGRIFEQMRRLGFTCDWTPGALHPRRRVRARHPHRVQGPLRRGPDLPRSAHRQLVPERPVGDQRRGDRLAGAHRHPGAPSLSHRGWRRHRGRDGATGDHARRTRRWRWRPATRATARWSDAP